MPDVFVDQPSERVGSLLYYVKTVSIPLHVIASLFAALNVQPRISVKFAHRNRSEIFGPIISN